MGNGNDSERLKEIKNTTIQTLKEIFQFDKNDLDFGIYRILNLKKKEISKFIDEDIFRIIENELKKTKETNIELQEEILSHIINFFSRYYDNGDFISKRRYSRNNKYAIPYNGEEVYLHWANFDQYYIKTGENFTNYSFKVGEWKINFEIKDDEIDIEKANIKDLEKKYFIFNHTMRVSDHILTIYFGYRGITDKEAEAIKKITKKKTIKRQDVDSFNLSKINSDIEISFIEELKAKHINFNGEPLESSELEWHLDKFTTKNTSDYFIHKNLKEFLTRELDFYIKNEIFKIDEFDTSILDFNLNNIFTFKSISKSIIDFLAQIEDFQKNLWEKKKFVLSTDYLITLDNINEKYYPEILENQDQISEWKKLNLLDIEVEINNLHTSLDTFFDDNDNSNLDLFEKNSTLTIDTKFFDDNFKYKILSEIKNLDDKTTGILVNSDNYHALKILSKKYNGKINCCYIDPPYNSDSTPIIYKNNYKDSSWLNLMKSRLDLLELLIEKEIGVISIAIDDVELSKLSLLLETFFPNYDLQKTIVIHYPGSGTGRKNVSRTHEYNLYLIPKEKDILKGNIIPSGKRVRGFRRAGTGENNYRVGRPNSFFAVIVDPTSKEIIDVEEPPTDDYSLADTTEGYKRIYPIGSDGSERVWSLSYEGAKQAVQNQELECSDQFSINRIYHDEDRRNLINSIWSNQKFNATSNGTNLLTSIFGVSGLFSYPKSLYTVKTAIDSITYFQKDAIVLDYFAGSGTTAHAVLKLNKEDDGKRKFILVEMGQYFDSVTKTRVQKVIYSDNWKDGKPLDNKGSRNQIVKYHSLEQYEDTLLNIDFIETQQIAVNSNDYEIKYMLDFESKNNPVLLNSNDLNDPFEYHIKIYTDDGIKTQKIDLIETFNYIAGIFVNSILRKQHEKIDYVIIEGYRQDKDVIVIWRNKPEFFDPIKDKEYIEKELLKDNSYDEILVNGNSLVENAKSLDSIFKKGMFGWE